MIDPKELKIGNCVNINGINTTIEWGILFDFDEGNWYVDNIHISLVKPIPLTEEWLIKFEFKKYEFDNKSNQYRLKDRLIVIRDKSFCDYGTSVKLHHVHQLQNLYFSLCGKELEIKL